MIEIAELEGADEATLRAFYDVEIAAHALERPYAVHRTFPQLCQMAAGGSEYFRRTLLVAREGGRILGTADLGRPLRDNLHLADLEVRVLPDARCRPGPDALAVGVGVDAGEAERAGHHRQRCKIGRAHV